MSGNSHSAGFVRVDREKATRRSLIERRKELAKEESQRTGRDADLPLIFGSSWGEHRPHNLRAPASVRPPVHRASSKTVGIALPFLAETGPAMDGAFIGPDLLSRGMFSWDPWIAKDARVIRSESMAIIGVKGSGKSMLAKSMATRLCRLHRRIAVPHDPNGEWTRVAEWVGGKTIRLGPGSRHRINFLDPGPRPSILSDDGWEYDVHQFQSQRLQAAVKILRQTTVLPEQEHTVIDLVLQAVRSRHTHVLIQQVYDELMNPTGEFADEIRRDGVGLQHTLRRIVRGDVAGMFDAPTSVGFDLDTPMVTVDTSMIEKASAEARALMRLATNDWIDRSTGASDQARMVIHEEAAVALLTEIASGSGLEQRAADEKVARHKRKSNVYLIHRIADLDALGDVGSALHSQALGLLADCETRVSYAQHPGELDRSAGVLGWNDTLRELVSKQTQGVGLWQIGQSKIAHIRNVVTPEEEAIFSTGGVQ